MKDSQNTTVLDLTPTWRGLLPALVAVATGGSDDLARHEAWRELYRMADALDAANAAAKAAK